MEQGLIILRLVDLFLLQDLEVLLEVLVLIEDVCDPIFEVLWSASLRPHMVDLHGLDTNDLL
jgi:hypothetical protein